MKSVSVIQMPEHGVDKEFRRVLFCVKCDVPLNTEEAMEANSALPKLGEQWPPGSGRMITSFQVYLPDGSDGRIWILTLNYKPLPPVENETCDR